MFVVCFGEDRSECLTITFLGRSHPGSVDYWDGNWLRTVVEVQAGGFQGKVNGDIRTNELEAFYRGLELLDETLTGEAHFDTMEQWLSICITCDVRGHLELVGKICDEPGMGNTLAFDLAFDQTYFSAPVTQMMRVVQAFPVIGQPLA